MRRSNWGCWAHYAAVMQTCGARRYRRMFWEACALGQVRYMAAAVRGTGIDCNFGDPAHDVLGLGGPTRPGRPSAEGWHRVSLSWYHCLTYIP
jgi:hypothetical protein